ncbi:reverse transcriptase domain-containing protein [Tanacetum coccineum]|uniref:Reverse transcriptase domain-containing protein n=1 Tax=Tanacetum coccineum TaxID=301880 RepID=A0ABQ4X489_9ASTR
MTKLLEKNLDIDFNEECIKAFETFKEKLTNAKIMVSPDWSQPFELMCDASDFAVGAVLGQHEGKHFRPIHFANKTLNNAQKNYTVTEKELLVIGFKPWVTTQLGKPIMLDSYTSNMCLSSWGRNTYARALVEFSAEEELKDSIVIAIPLSNGKGHTLVNDKCPKEPKMMHPTKAVNDGILLIALIILRIDVQKHGFNFNLNQRLRYGQDIIRKLRPAVMANMTFVNDFAGSHAIFKPYRNSDHSPSVLCIPTATKVKPKPFKFFNVLIKHDRFKEVVNEAWNYHDSVFICFVRLKAYEIEKAMRKHMIDKEYVKLSILNVLPFEEGRLPVKYLGVPLVSSRLKARDCKELVRNVSNRVLIWKEESPSIAGETSAYSSVISSIAMILAAVFVIPTGSMYISKACVISFGALVVRLKHFNSALLVSHIWNLLSLKESLWVKWVHAYKLNGRNFWDVPIRGNMSWSCWKILQIRPSHSNSIWRKKDRTWFHSDHQIWLINGVMRGPLASRGPLETYIGLDRVSIWDYSNVLGSTCPLCEATPDSHEHLHLYFCPLLLIRLES